jgi:hypothetical protein
VCCGFLLKLLSKGYDRLDQESRVYLLTRRAANTNPPLLCHVATVSTSYFVLMPIARDQVKASADSTTPNGPTWPQVKGLSERRRLILPPERSPVTKLSGFGFMQLGEQVRQRRQLVRLPSVHVHSSQQQQIYVPCLRFIDLFHWGEVIVTENAVTLLSSGC